MPFVLNTLVGGCSNEHCNCVDPCIGYNTRNNCDAIVVSGRQANKALTGTKCPGLCELLLLVFFSIGTVGTAYGDAALFIEEPYGFFGSINPTGHSAIYLNHVCADTPTILRRCQAGESGIVISRYSRIGKLDWIAIPLMPYLYAVDRAEDVPVWADATSVAMMRRVRDAPPPNGSELRS